MSDHIKLCKDCKHSRVENEEWPHVRRTVCKRPELAVMDFVNGVHLPPLCGDMRIHYAPAFTVVCGVAGHYWEPRE